MDPSPSAARQIPSGPKSVISDREYAPSELPILRSFFPPLRGLSYLGLERKRFPGHEFWQRVRRAVPSSNPVEPGSLRWLHWRAGPALHSVPITVLLKVRSDA